jgi:hypothetical protein
LVGNDERRFLKEFAFKLEECRATILRLYEMRSENAEQKFLNWTLSDRAIGGSAFDDQLSPEKRESRNFSDFSKCEEKQLQKQATKIKFLDDLVPPFFPQKNGPVDIQEESKEDSQSEQSEEI